MSFIGPIPFERPTMEDLRGLPRWARVVFAARCVRRVQPLFLKNWPIAAREFVDDVEMFLALAEDAARSGRPAEDDGNESSADLWAYEDNCKAASSVALAAEWVCCLARRSDREDAEGALYVACLVFRAIRGVAVNSFCWTFEPQWRAAEDARPFSVVRDAYYAARAAAPNPIAVVNAAGAAAAAAALRDFETLAARAKAEGWTDETPVDPDSLGSPWHGEPPPWKTTPPTGTS